MNHILFVEKLNEIKPDKEHLLSLGFSNSLSELFVKKFSIFPRKIQTSYNNELLALINNFDMTSFDIMGIEFDPKLTVKEKFLKFGRYDFGDLQFSRENYEIVLGDASDSCKIIMRVAKDGNTFLNSLFSLASYTIKNVTKDPEANKIDKSEFAALLATEAGGEEYVRFYKYVLGI